MDPYVRIKVGATNPNGGMVGIEHRTNEGDQVEITGFSSDPDFPGHSQATRYSHNLQTGETTIDHGSIEHGPIREAASYVWKHKKGAAVVASLTFSVAMGSLWVRRRKSD